MYRGASRLLKLKVTVISLICITQDIHPPAAGVPIETAGAAPYVLTELTGRRVLLLALSIDTVGRVRDMGMLGELRRIVSCERKEKKRR
jgi:hypothetical protein